MIILILQIISLFFLLVAAISIYWLSLINRTLNSKFLTLRWQEKAVGKNNFPAWGKVFESATYKPIAGAVIKIFDADTKEQLDSTTSATDGSFGFEVPDGKFYLRLNSFYHSFPSFSLMNKFKPTLARRRRDNIDYFGLFLPEIHDKGFENLYFGEIINNRGRAMQRIFSSKAQLLERIEAKTPLVLNIPLDKEEVLTLDQTTLESIKKQEVSVARVKIIALILGLGLGFTTFVLKLNIFSLIEIEIFLIFCLHSFLSQKLPKHHGIITDTEGKPLSFVLIRARGYRTKKIRATAITDIGGRFNIGFNHGWYTLEISHDRFGSETRLIKSDDNLTENKLNFKLVKNLP